jgi:hypothetical protein
VQNLPVELSSAQLFVFTFSTHHRSRTMSDTPQIVKMGHPVPDFELNAYDPVAHDFPKVTLSQIKEGGQVDHPLLLPGRLHLRLSDRVRCSGRAARRFAKMGAKLITVSTDTEFVHLAWKRDEKELADVKYAHGRRPHRQGQPALRRVRRRQRVSPCAAPSSSAPTAPSSTPRSTSTTWAATSTSSCASSRPTSTSSRKADEGCPSKWKDEGDATLRPGPDMVGKVHEALND